VPIDGLAEFISTGRNRAVVVPNQTSTSQPETSRLVPDIETTAEIDRDHIVQWFKSQEQSTGLSSGDEDIHPEGGTAGSDALEMAAEAEGEAEAETAILSRSHAFLSYPAYTLPLFVGGLLYIWVLHITSPPTTSSLRYMWYCVRTQFPSPYPAR
jgi:hypothetical protein